MTREQNPKNLWLNNKFMFTVLFSIFMFALSVSSADAVNCWDSDFTDQATCEAVDTNSDGNADDCTWDTWGSYCMEKGCWNYFGETDCTNANETGCFWKTGDSMFMGSGWCEEAVDCWNYWTETPCINVTGCLWKDTSCQGPPGCSDYSTSTTCDGAGIGCWWDSGNYCYKPGAWDYKTKVECEDASFAWNSNSYCQEAGGNCWDYSIQGTCELSASCEWESTGDGEGWCYKKGCWDYSTNATCETLNSCMWKGTLANGWCTEKECWNFWENTSACTGNTESLSCEWTGSGTCDQPNCNDYSVNDSTVCNSKTGCMWMNDTDTNLTGTCNWQGCWNYNDITSCDSKTNCYWDANYCYEYNCWTYDNTNQTQCETTTDSLNLDCSWDSNNGWCNTNWCGNYDDETACNNSISGKCYWDNGWCMEEGCWGQSQTDCPNKGCEWNTDWGYCNEAASSDCYAIDVQADCINATNTATCRWDSWSSSCMNKGCWDLQTNATCLAATLSNECEWTEDSSGWCEETGAQCWDYYLQNDCETNDCVWDSTWSTCYEKGCWSYWDNFTCVGDLNCAWKTQASSDWGWCEKRSCWNYDDTNSTACQSNAYNLSCTWDVASDADGFCFGPWNNNCWQYETWNGGNGSEGCIDNGCTWENKTGFCFEQIKGFSDFTNEGECMKSGWGEWNGSDCTAPTGGISFEGVNPGCWMFDGLSANCTTVKGCVYNTSAAECNGLDDGIVCANVTSQDMCGTIPMLSTCCKWTGNSCDVTYDTQCWDQMAAPPVGADHCMDYNAIDSPTICNQIAGDPWYMPCKWNNVSSQCEFKGDMATDVDNVKTKKNCEFLGGVWKSETICDDAGTAGNASDDIPKTTSWCEMGTGSSLYGCDVSCFACNTSTTCSASKKGYCTWAVDANHPQGGFCDIPDQMELDGDCDRFCGSCEYYSGGTSTPQKACKSSKSKCKWDNATSTCISKTDMGCVDDCFSCSDKNDCTLKGGGSQGTCKWDGSDNMCQPANFDGEICFDTIDNDQNNLVDCNDPSCMFDPFCGGGSMGDCWSYFDSTSCATNDCTWFQDPWTQMFRCGMKGENCWSFDQNQTGCGEETNCQWFGESFCEINHTKASSCFNFNSKTSCQAVTSCKWETDSFSPQGGWCDFAAFECHWNETLRESKTQCESKNYCTWNLDPWTNEGMCEPKCFARDSVGDPTYTTETGCNNAIAGGLCQWSTGWCEPDSTLGSIKGGDCVQYDDNQDDCNTQPGCAWYTDFYGGAGGGMGMGGSDCEPKMSAIDCHEYNQSACGVLNRNGTYLAGVEGNVCRWVNDGSYSWCDSVGMHCNAKYSPFCVGGTCYNQPQINESGCAADSYCILMNDSYTSQTICTTACMNESLNISTCQAVGDGDTCMWGGIGGGGECDYAYCDSACSACPDLNTTICPADCVTRCEGCHDVGSGGGGGGGGEGDTFGGWCDPAGMQVIFSAMEGGKPHEIAFDDCISDAGIPEWVDACFAGIKEMPDDYGFGIGLKSMTYAAACNGETLWDGSTGAGRKTTKGFIYLDTDNDATNNCDSDDGTQNGFEFKFIAEWAWSNDGLSETLTAKRCLNGSWAASKLALGTHTKKMCTELQGLMITAKKSDLADFTKLFKPQYPMRLYFVTANSTTTAANPSDSLGPGYYQSGGSDFKMEDCGAVGNVDQDADGFYAYEDPDCKYIYMDTDKGFKSSEDCVTPYDDDMDGFTNCDDSECVYEDICGGTLAVDSTDHTPPTIKERTVDNFLTKAVITYKTDERANGTLSFYYNDTTCTTLNATLRDKGLWNASAGLKKKYRFVHKGFVDNFVHTDALTYALNNNTAYYYKLKVCDISNNCKISGCLNFTTRTTAKESTIKITDPDSGQGWQIDKEGSGSFTNVGGNCISAGSSTNANLGVTVNPEEINEIGLKTNGSSASGDEMTLEFGGVSTSGDIVSDADVDTGSVTGPGGDTEDYFWMNGSGWDGDSGLHTQGAPDNMTLVFPGDDDELWDCESNSGGTLTGCTNITDSAARIYNSTTNMTTWIIDDPGADLWSFIIDQSPSSNSGGDDTTTSGGGGGGGGSGATSTVSKTQKWQVMSTGYTQMTIAKADLGFDSIKIGVNKKLDNVEITVKKLNSKPEAVTEPLNKLYQYIEVVKSVIKDVDVNDVKISIKVKKDWILNNSIDEDSVKVNRWEVDKWNSLSTTKASSDDTYVYYDATSPGLSYFAITASEVDAVVQEELLEVDAANVTMEEEEAESITAGVVEEIKVEGEEKKSILKTLLIVILPIVIIGVAILGYAFYTKKKAGEAPEEESAEEEASEEPAAEDKPL
ncbi:PGF-pre-PGF domain-containing protein [Candidatus Woesearchaeota archaeon]|nr:PGF-pre-PGF domain-containing protein [Candidatus Woesearchaeota archaeon]